MSVISRYVVAGFFFFICIIYSCSTSNEQIHKNELQRYLPKWVTDSFNLNPSNSFTKEKAELGRYLFYDRRLSVNNTKACASCHAQQFSFTDSYAKSIGAYGDLHLRNAKPLINLVFEKYLTAADSSLHYPEQQIINPMFNQHPVELGWTNNESAILQRIKNDKKYEQLFAAAYPHENNTVTKEHVQFAITSFIKTIFSLNSSYDRYRFQKDSLALNFSQKNGMALFFSDSLKCFSCHSGLNFASPSASTFPPYFITGLTSLATDSGMYRQTKNAEDIGRFKTPTLRNLAFTAPYLHDGSAATLEDVLLRYENADGNRRPKKDLFPSFKLTSQERTDLLAFLLSLSDSSILTNPKYVNPFTEDETNSTRQ